MLKPSLWMTGQLKRWGLVRGRFKETNLKLLNAHPISVVNRHVYRVAIKDAEWVGMSRNSAGGLSQLGPIAPIKTVA